MRALSLMQPWASLAAIGAKRFETRSWRTSYRGPLAIHASKNIPGWAREVAELAEFATALHAGNAYPLPTGKIIALAVLANCWRCRADTAATIGLPQSMFGDFSKGRYLFELDDVRPLAKPIPYSGRLGLWSVPPELAIRIDALAIPQAA